MIHHFPITSVRAIRAKNRIEQAARRVGDPLENIELLGAACQLAPKLYTLRGEAFNVGGVWTLLSASERMHYVDLCIELLREVDPNE